MPALPPEADLIDVSSVLIGEPHALTDLVNLS
jgi:hypothetical protein